jgi:hypothetical protein
MDVPKSMVVERIRGRSGTEMADRADKELPEKIDLDADAELLSKYDIDPEELREEFRGQAPAAT